MLDAKWLNRFMDMAELTASWSKDPSTKVGAVLTSGKEIISLGYNGFPPGTEDYQEIYADRPRKYLRIIHAEANALLSAQGRRGLDDLHLFTTLCPCANCTALIIRYGVKFVLAPVPTVELVERWGDSFKEAVSMMQESGVILNYLPR